MSINFNPEELRDIAELAEHMDHVAPVPRPDGKRLPMRVSLGDGSGAGRWVVHIDLDPELSGPLVNFTEVDRFPDTAEEGK